MSDHTRDEEHADRDAGLDETLAATFPASDPLSTDPNPSHPDEGVGNMERDERRGRGPQDTGKSGETPGRR
jgi:hypothetical protein